MVKKKVLVTGCSGYIGSHLCKMLENDYDVYGVDINVPQLDTLIDYYNIDIRKLFDLPEEFDTVIHLAALVNVGESEVNPISYYITNLNGTMNVINKINTKNFIFSPDFSKAPYVSGINFANSASIFSATISISRCG